MIRGEPAIGRDQSREPRLYSVEPVWGPDHEAVIRFCGQGAEAAGPFSQRHCSHSRMRIAATIRKQGVARTTCLESLVSRSLASIPLELKHTQRSRPAMNKLKRDGYFAYPR